MGVMRLLGCVGDGDGDVRVVTGDDGETPGGLDCIFV